MSHKADCPFCKAFAVEVPGPPNQEWLWQLPNDSPMKQLKAKVELLERDYSAICTKCGYMRPATEIEKENEALQKIKRVARLYLEHGEPELADELDALLKDGK